MQLKKLLVFIFFIVTYLVSCTTMNPSQVEDGLLNYKDVIKRIKPMEAKKLIDEDKVIIIDVRSPKWYKEGHIKGAINIPLKNFSDQVPKTIEDKNKPILVYCYRGIQSNQAAQQLAHMGYTVIYDLGGIENSPYPLVQ